MRWSSIAAAQRILAREQRAVVKDWGGRLPIALIYPNTYYVGMSSLALQTLYQLFNAEPDIVCERVFCGLKRLEYGSPPFSLETQRPVAEFAVLATTLSFELDYLNAVILLRNAGIPLLSSKRDQTHPLLLAGGPAVSANPEPLAEIYDAFVIGEVEEILPSLLKTLCQSMSGSRHDLLDRLAQIPGLYVPSLLGTERQDDVLVQRQWVRDLDRYPTHTSIFAQDTEFGDLFLAEIARGCRRGCRFCLAGCLYRPLRERRASTLLDWARAGRLFRSRIGLVSAAVSDYSEIEELVTGLQNMDMQVSVSSLRVDPVPEVLLQALAASKARTLTVAPEAGSERLRRMIRKGISQEDILRAAEAASRHGFAELKLYFMIGLPGEQEQDMEAIIALVGAIGELFRRHVRVSVAPFVPKAHTPFQRQSMAPVPVLRQRLQQLQAGLRKMGVRMASESIDWARVQAVLARGDRQLGSVLASIRRPTLSNWRTALREHGLTSDSYASARGDDERLPWAFIASQASSLPAQQSPTGKEPRHERHNSF
jgi:radical SAM superfamily enzyme YgiQ (UPF0313 family)